MNTDSLLLDWQILMRQWIEKNMGDKGITLPFLAGALALKRGENTVSAESLRELIGTMIATPLPGHFVGVQKCSDIQEPVLSLLPLGAPFVRQYEALAPDGQISISFSPEAMSAIDGLDCDCISSCIERLVQCSSPYTEAENFSRVYDVKTKRFVYSRFSAIEVEFIRKTLALPTQSKT